MTAPTENLHTHRDARILVTIPARNEESFIEQTVLRLNEALSGRGLSFKLAVAEDGSTDGTKEALKRLEQRIPGLIISESDSKLGRGLALRKLWAEIDADVYIFVDADLASGTEPILTVAEEVVRGSPVVTGSRYCPGAQVDRPLIRMLVSIAYNGLVRLLFDEPVTDHQCGLKGFDRAVVRRLFPYTHENSWAWDTEILVLASKAGIQIRELPVVWREYRYARTPLSRLISDIWLHGVGLLHLRASVSRGKFSELVPDQRAGPVAPGFDSQPFTPASAKR